MEKREIEYRDWLEKVIRKYTLLFDEAQARCDWEEADWYGATMVAFGDALRRFKELWNMDAWKLAHKEWLKLRIRECGESSMKALDESDWERAKKDHEEEWRYWHELSCFDSFWPDQ